MVATAFSALLSMETEEARIARGLRHRDPDLLDALIAQYQHRLLRYLLHLTGNHATAEDLFQETWMRVLEKGHLYDGRSRFVTWLLTIAHNVGIDHLRRRRPASLDEMHDPKTERPSKCRTRGLLRSNRRLPTKTARGLKRHCNSIRHLPRSVDASHSRTNEA